MKNYYDELEVSKTASKEVIEKVYKVLAKKYHPDTTKEINKQAAEEKFKIISEAYETLSNDEKRKKYDLEFKKSNPTISYSEYINVLKQRDALNHELNRLKNSSTSTHTSYNKMDSNSNTINNTSNNPNTNYNNHTCNMNHSNQQKKTYYYTNTRKPASAFDYFKYKIKEFFTHLFLLFLSIILTFLIFNTLFNFNLFIK